MAIYKSIWDRQKGGKFLIWKPTPKNTHTGKREQKNRTKNKEHINTYYHARSEYKQKCQKFAYTIDTDYYTCLTEIVYI